MFHLQCIICTILLALALIAGGAASAANAAHIQNEYIDSDIISAVCDQPENSVVEDFCNDFDTIRNSQAATAVSNFHDKSVDTYIYHIAMVKIFKIFHHQNLALCIM